MELDEIRKLREELEGKMVYGDFHTLSKMLNIGHDAARKRFKRDNEQAVLAMKEFIEAREAVFKIFKSIKED